MNQRPESVQRIHLGRIFTPNPVHGAEHHGYIVGLGQRPKSAKGGLFLVGKPTTEDKIYSQLEKAVPALRACSLSGDESPYADKGGHLSAFADELFRDIPRHDVHALIERIVENRPYISPGAEMINPRTPTFEPPFRFLPDFLVPDSLPCAGEILSQGKRVLFDEAVGGSFFSLAHVMEPYLLSAAALRTRGYSAYPANAVVPGEHGEIFHPLIAIVDLSNEVPLLTFDIMSVHPPMGSVDILGDLAVKAVTFTMLAQARIKHLTTEMVLLSEGGSELPMEELTSRLGRVADALFECHRRWPGCHFIGSTLDYAVEDIASALVAIQLSELGNDIERLSAEHPELMAPGALETGVHAAAVQTAMNFAGHIQSELALRVARGR